MPALIFIIFAFVFNAFADEFDNQDVYYAANTIGLKSTNVIYAGIEINNNPSPDKVLTGDNFTSFNNTMTINTPLNYNNNNYQNTVSNNYATIYIPYSTNNLVMQNNYSSTINNLVQYDNNYSNATSQSSKNNDTINDLVQHNLPPASPAKPSSLINAPIIINRLLPFVSPVETAPVDPLKPYEDILRYHFGTANFAYNLNPDGSYVLSNNIIITADGKVVDIAGNVYNADGSITSITGTTRYKNGSIKDEKGLVYNLDGTINLPEGSYIDTNGITHNNDGSVVLSDGTIYNTDGSIVYPNGTVLTQSGRVIKRTKKATEREELAREQNAWKYDPVSNKWQQSADYNNSSIYK